MDRALVIVDIQEDYFPGGRMELVGSQEASLRAGELLEDFRRRGEPLFHIQHVFQGDDAPFFAPGSQGAEIHPDVKPLEGEQVIVKHFPNAFKDTPLLDELRARGVREVVMCGMMTSMCVDASARAAADYGFDVTLVADACAAPDLRSGDEVIPGATVHNAFLAALGSLVADVRTTGELLGERGH